MNKIAVAARRLIVAIVLLAVLFICIDQYSLIFSRKVKGEVVAVKAFPVPGAVLHTSVAGRVEGLYSFAVAIKEEDGQIVTASGEDRQWGLVQSGMCVEARYYPYPPWNFEKAGTYFNARLLNMRDCKNGGLPLVPATPDSNAALSPGLEPGSGPGQPSGQPVNQQPPNQEVSK